MINANVVVQVLSCLEVVYGWCCYRVNYDVNANVPILMKESNRST